jgi:hypothetical protein
VERERYEEACRTIRQQELEAFSRRDDIDRLQEALAEAQSQAQRAVVLQDLRSQVTSSPCHEASVEFSR